MEAVHVRSGSTCDLEDRMAEARIMVCSLLYAAASSHARPPRVEAPHFVVNEIDRPGPCASLTGTVMHALYAASQAFLHRNGSTSKLGILAITTPFNLLPIPPGCNAEELHAWCRPSSPPTCG